MSKNLLKINCKECSTEFMRYKSMLSVGNNFCSIICRGNFDAKNPNHGKWNIGLIRSSETKGKIGLANKHMVPPSRLGIKFTEEQKIKLRVGRKPWNYIGDRTKLKTQGDRRSSAYGNWRRQVWLRDNFKCKIGNPDCKGRLEAHHILGYTYYPELRYDINNGITLCHAHHPFKRAEEKRLASYFMELVSVSKEQF